MDFDIKKLNLYENDNEYTCPDCQKVIHEPSFVLFDEDEDDKAFYKACSRESYLYHCDCGNEMIKIKEALFHRNEDDGLFVYLQDEEALLPFFMKLFQLGYFKSNETQGTIYVEFDLHLYVARIMADRMKIDDTSFLMHIYDRIQECNLSLDDEPLVMIDYDNKTLEIFDQETQNSYKEDIDIEKINALNDTPMHDRLDSSSVVTLRYIDYVMNNPEDEDDFLQLFSEEKVPLVCVENEEESVYLRPTLLPLLDSTVTYSSAGVEKTGKAVEIFAGNSLDLGMPLTSLPTFVTSRFSSDLLSQRYDDYKNELANASVYKSTYSFNYPEEKIFPYEKGMVLHEAEGVTIYDSFIHDGDNLVLEVYRLAIDDDRGNPAFCKDTNNYYVSDVIREEGRKRVILVQVVPHYVSLAFDYGFNDIIVRGMLEGNVKVLNKGVSGPYKGDLIGMKGDDVLEVRSNVEFE